MNDFRVVDHSDLVSFCSFLWVVRVPRPLVPSRGRRRSVPSTLSPLRTPRLSKVQGSSREVTSTPVLGPPTHLRLSGGRAETRGSLARKVAEPDHRRKGRARSSEKGDGGRTPTERLTEVSPTTARATGGAASSRPTEKTRPRVTPCFGLPAARPPLRRSSKGAAREPLRSLAGERRASDPEPDLFRRPSPTRDAGKVPEPVVSRRSRKGRPALVTRCDPDPRRRRQRGPQREEGRSSRARPRPRPRPRLDRRAGLGTRRGRAAVSGRLRPKATFIFQTRGRTFEEAGLRGPHRHPLPWPLSPPSFPPPSPSGQTYNVIFISLFFLRLSGNTP